MFWTEIVRQHRLFVDDDDHIASTCVSQLIAFAEEHFPGQGPEFYRRFAFLTHKATQNFLAPMLKARYGTLDGAKEPTMLWLREVGSFETFARSTRATDGVTMLARESVRKTPAWYVDYLGTARFRDMKHRAVHLSDEQMGGITCAFNSRHPFEVMHHRDYGRLGQGDEFRYLTPYCHECHRRMRVHGPAVPAAVPEGVKQWLKL